MQAQTILTDVRRELVETSAAYWSDAELLRHLNRGEADFTNKTRILEDTAQLSLVQGQLNYSLPQNWMSVKDVLFKIVSPDGTFRWKRLYPSNLEKMTQLRQNFLNTETGNQGTPSRYWIWRRELWLDRAPDAENATTIFLFFKCKPIPLTAATQEINLDDSLSEALFEYIMWKALRKEQEFDAADEHKLEYDRYVLEGRKWVKKQSGDQRNRIDIDSGVPLDGGDSTSFSDPLAI